MLRVEWDMQALKVQKDRKGTSVITGWMALQASGVARARPAPEARSDFQALERKVKEVPPGRPGLSARPDPKVRLEFMDLLGHQVFRVSVARQDHLGITGTEGCLESKDLKGTLVTRVSEV